MNALTIAYIAALPEGRLHIREDGNRLIVVFVTNGVYHYIVGDIDYCIQQITKEINMRKYYQMVGVL